MPLFGPSSSGLSHQDAMALRRIERKLDFLLSHLGIPAEPADNLDEVRLLISEGKKIEAIKRYRELTGAGLAEAKDAVDRGV